MPEADPTDENAVVQAPLTTYAVPPPRERGEMLYVFRSEIVALRKKVERVGEVAAGDFLNAAFALIGISVGALIGLLAAYHGSGSPGRTEAVVLWSVFLCGAGMALVCFIASRKLQEARQSVRADIVADLKRIEYEAVTVAGDPGAEAGEQVEGGT
jgi:hypothetical protein